MNNTVVLAITDFEVCESVREFLHEYEYTIVDEPIDADDLMFSIMDYKPSIAIVGGDICDEIASFSELECGDTCVCAFVDMSDAFLVSKLKALGVHVLDVSSMDFSMLHFDVSGGDKPFGNNAVYVRLVSILMDHRIPVKLGGFGYIVNAVMLALHDPTVLDNVKANLYPAVATMNDTTGEAVEHAMRTAVYNSNCIDHPTVAEFLAYVTKLLSIEFNIIE